MIPIGLVFDNHPSISRYGVPDRLNCATTSFAGWQVDATGFEVAKKHQITFEIAGKANPSAVTFDSMGRPVSNVDTSINDCAQGCIINVTSNLETLQIKIESQGYIHAI